MGRKCCVPECNSNYDAIRRLGHATISTFKFPYDPEIRERWIKAVNRCVGWRPSQTASVCINHFRPEDILKYEKPAKLKPTAVPTILRRDQNSNNTLVKRGRPKKIESIIGEQGRGPRINHIKTPGRAQLREQCVKPVEGMILGFESFVQRLSEKNDFGNWRYHRDRNVVHFYYLQDQSNENAIRIINSIKVFDDMRISLFLKEVKQADKALRWVLGDNTKMYRWSQFETILLKYDAKSCSMENEYPQNANLIENKDNLQSRIEEDDENGSWQKLDVSDNESYITTNVQETFNTRKEIEFLVVPSTEDCNNQAKHEKQKKNPLHGIEKRVTAQSEHNERREMKETIRSIKNTKHKCFICDLEHESNEAFEQHIPEHIPMLPYRCDRCVNNEVTIKTLASLNKHFLMHLKPLKCGLCDVRFLSYGARLLHEQNNHENSGPISCEVCGKALRSRRGYQHHLKIHINPEAMKCQLCHKQLSSEYELKLHMRIHTKEKPNKCPFCTTSFNRISNLVEHKRRFHHKFKTNDESHKTEEVRTMKKKPIRMVNSVSITSGQIEYRCKICDERMQTLSSYHSHMRKHRKQYQCSYCGIRFGQLRDFIDHENTHTGKRPYQCEVCSMKFRTSSTYYGHRAVHSKKKFPCKECGQRFSRLRHLVVHSKIHTTTENG
ncbi:zinc finger protein 724-like [Toxorhynchites rutilus septentrionalis]|uniref:zinc finger protein 724-like n=1 Tax=Toxorhynchites rutilus septentrionalis TaxID=329112 RepID=UPI0024787E9A|nr:zinc finger protein 724-like [Toxorhynchites rutilus septentrionalis]